MRRRKLIFVRHLTAITSIAISCFVVASAQNTASEPIFTVNGPTIIAFFPATQAEADQDADTSEALDDFNFCVAQVRARLETSGIIMKITNKASFRIRLNGKMSNFRNGQKRAGYYFIAPRKSPHVEYDVMTGQDILDTARRYFGISIR